MVILNLCNSFPKNSTLNVSVQILLIIFIVAIIVGKFASLNF